jgi:hypothetical protein
MHFLLGLVVLVVVKIQVVFCCVMTLCVWYGDTIVWRNLLPILKMEQQIHPKYWCYLPNYTMVTTQKTTLFFLLLRADFSLQAY